MVMAVTIVWKRGEERRGEERRTEQLGLDTSVVMAVTIVWRRGERGGRKNGKGEIKRDEEGRGEKD